MLASRSRLLAVVLAVAISAPACGDSESDGPVLGACADSVVADELDRCNYLVGDSTFALLLAHSETPGNADAGCGFRDDAGLVRSMTGENPNSGCQIDWEADTPELDDGAIIVIGVSIHDAMCRAPADDLEAMDCAIDASVYGDVVEHYRPFGDVAVVEVPPVDAEGNAGFAEVSNDRLVELNRQVAQTLGCELIGYDVRLESPLYDGLHYFPGEFTEPTVISLVNLSPEQTCDAG